MQTQHLGYPRNGSNRELKKAYKNYWQGKISVRKLTPTGKNACLQNWKLQQEAGLDLFLSHDFSFYDQISDLSLVHVRIA